jgi:Ca2+-transporting ATPase
MTSENLHARAIAFKCGILNHDEDLNNEAVVEGEIFRTY